ncbi:hypothetical protein D3C78_1066390 [compost metagenome]
MQRLDELLACQLRLSIYGLGISPIILIVGLRALTVKHIIRTDITQLRSSFTGRYSHVTSPRRIHTKSLIRLGFGLVHSRISRTMNNDIRLMERKAVSACLQASNIQSHSIESNYLSSLARP